MRACKQLTDSIKGGHKWLRSRIKEDEKIINPNVLQQFNLCTHYQTLYHAPFADDMDEFYKCCEVCESKQNNDDIFNSLHTKKYGEIIWGKVVKN